MIDVSTAYINRATRCKKPCISYRYSISQPTIMVPMSKPYLDIANASSTQLLVAIFQAWVSELCCMDCD